LKENGIEYEAFDYQTEYRRTQNSKNRKERECNVMWAIKLALAPRPLMIYCAFPLAAAMIITVAAPRIVLAHGSKPT
jgi:hypothetical protein